VASVCELLEAGRVLSIRGRAAGRLPEHPRITYVTGNPLAAATQEEVRATIGEGAMTMLMIGGGRRGHVLRLFDAFSSLVSVGSYAVIEDTVLNGHPVLPEFGPGPAEAVREIAGERRDFVVDVSLERFGLSFNPNGYLRRVK
jgi:cephalosporin hydroxylase